MSARQQNNVQHLLIGGTANLSTGAIASLNSGEIGIYSPAGLRIVESGASTGEINATQGMEFFLALGGSSPLQRTPVIKGSNIKSIKAVAFSAGAEQIDYIGFNGTSGSIEAIDSNLYMVQVYVEDYLTSSHDGRYIKHFQYESDSSATQAEIADGLFASAVYNWSREAKDANGDPFMKFEMLMDNGSDAAVGTSVNNVVFTKGSKTISADDIDDGTGSAAFAVGDYIRVPDGSRYDVTLTGTSGTANITIGGTAYLATFSSNLTTTAANFVTSHATALSNAGYTVTAASGVLTVVKKDGSSMTAPTSANVSGDLDATIAVDAPDDNTPVYRITAISAANNTATLSVPYQGATITHADTLLKRITAASAAGEECGLKVRGVAKSHVTGKEHYGKVRFSINLKDFGTTVVTNSTAADEGVGVINSVKDLEWFCKGNQGEYFRMGEPVIHGYTSDVSSTVAGGGYDFLSIKVESSDVVGFQNNISPMEVTLATPATAPDFMTNTTDGLRDVLEAIAGTGLVAAAGLDV